MNNYAPVLIITLNRYEHFKNCIESLSASTDAGKTDLYIALDYPLKDSHWEGYYLIDNYINTIKGFKSINIIKRTKNLGAEGNLLTALKFLFKVSDRIIYLEDDNEVSTNFINYMNKGLEIYEERDDIFSICGYNYPVKIPKEYKEDVYLWQGFSAWGVGVWKKKWEKLDWDISEMKTYISNKVNIHKINKVAIHLYPALKQIVYSGKITGDTFISYYQIKNNCYTIFPVISRVRNWGHDGTGINCGVVDIYRNQKILMKDILIIMPSELKSNILINKSLSNFFKTNLLQRIKNFLKRRIIIVFFKLNLNLFYYDK